MFKENMAAFGLRHQGGTGQTLQGSIADARIYDWALTADEIRKLEPNRESEIKPYAWWTFEKGEEADRTGRFPVNSLSGGARIEGGRLVVKASGATLIAAATSKPVQNRFWPIVPSGTYKLRLVVVNGMVDIYVDDVLVTDYYIADMGDGRVSLVSREGTCRFGDASYRAIKATGKQ